MRVDVEMYEGGGRCFLVGRHIIFSLAERNLGSICLEPQCIEDRLVESNKETRQETKNTLE